MKECHASHFALKMKTTSSLWIYWRTTRLQEGSSEQVDVQEKMLGGFLRNDFERRLL
jgi:hypothetical protein